MDEQFFFCIIVIFLSTLDYIHDLTR